MQAAPQVRDGNAAATSRFAALGGRDRGRGPNVARRQGAGLSESPGAHHRGSWRGQHAKPGRPPDRAMAVGASRPRSEEHTSELQSRRDLVCRLLLEKKKKK